MLDAVCEMFLSEYFLFDSVIGRMIDDKKDLFLCLSKIFLLSKRDADRLFQLVENESVKSIVTEKDYLLYLRTRKYFELTDDNNNFNRDHVEAINIKGNAICLAKAQKLLTNNAPRNTVYNNLLMAAGRGVVSALRMIGILQCEGIFFDKDTQSGIKNLNKAADWNDIVSTMAILHYSSNNREYNLSRLNMEVLRSPLIELCESAKKRYKISSIFDVPEVRILNKAFNCVDISKEAFNSLFVRILYSPALNVKDKESILFSMDKERLSVIGNLPLKLSMRYNVLLPNIDTVLNRVGEKKRIERSALNIDLREISEYRPLCLVCDSKYILNKYAKAMSFKNDKLNVERIEIAALTEYDFEPSANNIFVRSVNEDKDNWFLLFFYGECSANKIEIVKNFLLSSKRAKFHLNSPSVDLNLGPVLPICFCDRKNAKLLSDCCDIIQLADVTAEELPFAVTDIIDRKKKIYGVEQVILDKDIDEIFDGYDIDLAERFIDSAIMANRESGAQVILARKSLVEYARNNSRSRIGFGGIINGD